MPKTSPPSQSQSQGSLQRSASQRPSSQRSSPREPRTRPRIDMNRKPLCLPDGVFDMTCIGMVYWVFISVQQAALAGLQEHHEALMSEDMRDDVSWYSHTIASGDPLKNIPSRPSIVIRCHDVQSADIICTATFDGKPLEQADPHLQHMAVALQGTAPWPSADSPVITLNEAWPTSPSYAVAHYITIVPPQVKKLFHMGRYRLSREDLLHMMYIMNKKRNEIRVLGVDEVRNRVAQFPRANRDAPSPRRKGRKRGCATSAGTGPPSQSWEPTLDTVGEDGPVAQPPATPATNVVGTSRNQDAKPDAVSPQVQPPQKPKRNSWAKENLYKYMRSRSAK